jgi:hypothetical protein
MIRAAQVIEERVEERVSLWSDNGDFDCLGEGWAREGVGGGLEETLGTLIGVTITVDNGGILQHKNSNYSLFPCCT